MSYQVGNTLKMTIVFKDFNDELVDPDTIKFIVYDAAFSKILTSSIGPLNRTGLGEYFYLFTPLSEGRFTYEWFCELQGLPSLKRIPIDIRKV